MLVDQSEGHWKGDPFELHVCVPNGLEVWKGNFAPSL